MSDKPGKNTGAWLDDEPSVSRAYGKLKKPEPPTHLDQQILAEARRAAAAEDNTVVRVHRWRKWTMPAALAATVVFAVPLVVRVFENTSSDFDRAPAPVAMTETLATEAAPADAVVGTSATPAARDISPQAMFDTSVEKAARADERRDSAVAVPKSAVAERLEQFQVVIPPSAPAPPAETQPAAVETQSRERPEIVPTAAAPETSLAAGNLAAGKSDDRQDADAGFAVAIPMHSEEEAAAAKRESVATAGRLERTVAHVTPPGEAYRQQDGAAASDSSGFATTVATPVPGYDAELDEVVVTGNRLIEPEPWLIEISRLHERGRVQTARRELGEFLTTYPDYELPDFYPLQASDAIYPKDPQPIVPEAESWLRGIGQMADRGDIDQARMQLAEFLARYPDYPLPADFPLNREDASIDR